MYIPPKNFTKKFLIENICKQQKSRTDTNEPRKVSKRCFQEFSTFPQVFYKYLCPGVVKSRDVLAKNECRKIEIRQQSSPRNFENDDVHLSR